MDKAKKKILITRILRVCILAAAAVALFLLGKIPEVAEYFFARGLTRGAGRIIGFLTGLLPVSFYEWTAVFLIVGGVASVRMADRHPLPSAFCPRRAGGVPFGGGGALRPDRLRRTVRAPVSAGRPPFPRSG